ncbi:MAG: hypothetical protein ABIH11_06770 [Candidatus Altiarchaeota archaeon]
MGLGKLNGVENRGGLGENTVFLATAFLVLFAAGIVYAATYLGDAQSQVNPLQTTPTTSTSMMPSITESTTTTIKPTPTTQTTTPPAVEDIESSTPSSTSTPTSTGTTIPYYMEKYSGKGYRQAYVDITFFCPSCVPAVARNLQNEAGVISKSMSYAQKTSWIIYDPRLVELDRIIQLAGANGEATLLNDTEIK